MAFSAENSSKSGGEKDGGIGERNDVDQKVQKLWHFCFNITVIILGRVNWPSKEVVAIILLN